MKTPKMKKILPLLLTALLFAGPVNATTDHAAPARTQHQTTAAHDSGGGYAADHEHDAGHSKAEHHAESMLAPKKLKDLLWRTLNFAALVFLLVKFGGRPIAKYLGDRRQSIADELKEMENRRDEAEQACTEFETRLAGMEDEIALMVERATASAAKEKKRILAEAEQAAQEIRRQAEAAVQAAVTAARRGLQEEVAEQAAAMAEQLIVKNLTPTDHVALIEQYLDKTGKAR
jgi:F-type H+-transporting ATPase subunit b